VYVLCIVLITFVTNQTPDGVRDKLNLLKPVYKTTMIHELDGYVDDNVRLGDETVLNVMGPIVTG
jgi:hypothetical protein